MKKFLFLSAMLFIIAGLMAGVINAIPGQASANAAPKYPSRDIFYTEDFESGATGWTHYDGAVSPNNWHVYANGDAQGDVWWMGDPANGGYHNHQYLVLDTPVIAISTGSSTLTFKMRHGLEEPGASGDYDGWDSFNVRVSTNSGVSYSVLPNPAPAYDFANSYAFGSEFGEGLGVPGWGGQRTTWTTVTYDLSSYLVGGAANVKIRFAFAADPAYCTDDDASLFGVMVDDIALASFSNNGASTGMTYASLVPTAGDFWHVATDAGAPSPTHIMSSVNSAGTYSINMLDYLESPAITLPGTATQIVADFQLKGTYSDTGTFPDVDYFGWEIYHGGAWHYMSNPYSNPALSNYVFSSAPDVWASMVNSYTGVDGDISLLAGQEVKFRWYFQSNDNTPSGTPLQIDNFQLFSVSAAPAPPNIVYPANGATGLPYTGFEIDWSASSLGATPEYYTVYMDQTEENLELATFNPAYTSEELAVSYYDPVAAGLLTFASSERWYFRIGASVVGQDDAFSDIYRFDIINSANVVTTYPWSEGFEGTTFPPTNWTRANVDNDAVQWAQNTSATYAHASTKSAYHAYSTAVPDPGQNGWLITPALQLPSTGTAILSFWNYNRYPPADVNQVMVNTNNDPNDPYWVQVWSQDETTAAWANELVNLNAYAGQIIYLGFNYRGYDMNNWYVDDVNVTIYTQDMIGPIITHLPVINTPREDLTYTVNANIVDDAAFHNPIGGAYVYYSTNGGSSWSAPISMTAGTAPAYSADIPAQALGTTVTYKIDAWDSMNNHTVTANYSFSVTDPAWLRYFTTVTTYTGYPSYVWGPVVMFENPFYGTNNAMRLSQVSGRSYYASTANIHVYSYDGVDMLDMITPVAVSFAAQTLLTTDLTAYNIQITTPYFLVAYEDMPVGNYFGFSTTYNYGTSYANIGGDLYTMSSSGSWCISAYAGTGAFIPAVPDVAISYVGGVPHLAWTADPTAHHYLVYGADTPYAADPWTLLGTPLTNSFDYTGTEIMKFFKVYANSEATRGVVLPATVTDRVFPITPQSMKTDLMQ